MKLFVLFIALSMFCLTASGQARGVGGKVLNYQQHDTRTYHFGFCIGLNVMNFDITHSHSNYSVDSLRASVTNLSPGFHIQAVTAARLTDNLEVRLLPGVAFGHRELSFYKDNQLYSVSQILESSYITLPLLLKYKSVRINNYRPYMTGGLNPRFDLARTYREDDDIYMDLKLLDLCYEFGAGADFYFPFFKLTVELRGSWGMFNVLNHRDVSRPEFQNAIEKLRSSVYMISIYIE